MVLGVEMPDLAYLPGRLRYIHVAGLSGSTYTYHLRRGNMAGKIEEIISGILSL